MQILKLKPYYKHFFSSLLFLFIAMFPFSGCKKDVSENIIQNVTNPQIEDFLRIPVNSVSELKIVSDDFRKQLSTKNFVNNFLQWHGKPDWEKAIKIKTYDSSVVVLIPTIKDNEVLAFIGISYKKGSFKYELHRKSSVVSNRKEYSYIGFTENINKWFLNYFDQNPEESKNDNSTFENIAPPPFCWYILVRVSCNLQKKNSVPTTNMEAPCYGWTAQCSEDDGNGNPGGGGGGGGCTNCNPPECPQEVLWYNIIPDNPCQNIPHSPTVIYLNNLLNLSPDRLTWLNSHQYEASVIKQMVDSNWIFIEGDDIFTVDPNAKIASRITIDAMMVNYINGPYNAAHYNHIKHNIPGYENHPNFDPIYWMHFRIQCVILRVEHPEWSNAKIYWEASKEMVHLTLDIVGLIPVVGEIADLANGAIYTIEGDGVNATLSYAAMIPIGGWVATGTKLAKKTFVIASNGSKRTLKWYKLPNNIIEFGDRKLLRKVLGLADGDARVAHHLLPWEHGVDDLVQKAAEGYKTTANGPDFAFHLNEAFNGIPLSAFQHNGSHALYNARVKAHLINIKNTLIANGQFTPQKAKEAVENLINNVIRPAITNSNLPINQIVF